MNNVTLENEFCKKEKASLESTIAELKKTNKELKEKLKTITQEKSSMQAMDMSATKQKEELDEEIEKLKAEISEKDTAIIEHELNVQRLESELSKQKKLLAETMASHQDSDTLLNQIKDLHNELLKSKEQYELQIAELSQKNSELEQKLQAAGGEKSKLEKTIADDNARLKLELIQAKDALGKSEEKIRALENQLAVTIPRKSEADDKQLKELLNKIKEDNARLKEEINSKAAEYKELVNQLEELKEELEKSEVKRQKVTTEMAEKTETINNMKHRMEALEVDLVRTKQDLGEAMNVVNEFELKNINLREQLEKALTMKAHAEQQAAKKGKK